MSRRAGVGCSILIINFFLGGVCTQYVVNFWMGFIQGVPVHMPFLPAAIAGLFVGQFTIPLAVLTWAVSFVVPGV